jgi:hypothetical protein
LIVLSRLIITVRICDVISLTSSLKVSMMVEHLSLNFRFAFSALIIRAPASSSAYMSVPVTLSNLFIFLLTCFKARLKEAFSFLNTARIFYTEFRRFPISVSIKILITISRSIIVIPIYAFIAEKFVLRSIIAFWLRRSHFWLVIFIFLTRFLKSLETKIILFVIVEILSIFPFVISSWLSKKEIFFWNTIRTFFSGLEWFSDSDFISFASSV